MLTIVIPFYNRASYLRRTLDSVAAQTLRPLSVILVDNASTDRSAEIAREWMQTYNRPDFQVSLISEARRGAPAARNAGLAQVTTPYVMFFDSDDIMLAGHCASMLAALEKTPDADIVGKSIIYKPINGKSIPGYFTTRRRFYSQIFMSILSTQRYIVRTDLARAVGGWNERTVGWDDYEFGLRLLLKNPVLATAEGDPTVIFEQHADSITGTDFSSQPSKWEDTLDICAEDLRRAGRSDLLPLLDIRRMILAATYAREGAHEHAKRLRSQVLKTTQHPLRMCFAYMLQRTVGHGNTVVSKYLFPKLASDCPMKPTEHREPAITVVIPYYNRAKYLRRTLDSVASQTFRPLNVILVDNGSTDKSAEVAREWSEIYQAEDFRVTMISEERRGAPAARNAGLAQVATPYVMFFDSDDIMLPEHCEYIMRAISKSPDADVVGKPIVYRTLKGRKIEGFFTTRRPLYNHIFHCILATQRYVVRTSLAREAGGWDNRAWGWNDYEFGLRLLLKNPVLAQAEGEPTVIFQQHADSITGTAFSTSPMKWEDTLGLCSEDLRRAGRTDLEPLLDMRRVILAANYAREGARSESRRLRQRVFKSSPYAWRMRLTYALQRVAGHGCAILARFIFPSLCKK